MRLKELRKTLNECHISTQDKHLDFFESCDESYLLQRIKEEASSTTIIDSSLVFMTRLINIVRQKRRDAARAALHNEGQR